jgi:hypothetical protein
MCSARFGPSGQARKRRRLQPNFTNSTALALDDWLGSEVAEHVIRIALPVHPMYAEQVDASMAGFAISNLRERCGQSCQSDRRK